MRRLILAPVLLISLATAASTVVDFGPGARTLDAAEAVSPNRLLDTREGVGAPTGRLQAGSTIELAITAPASSGATGVVLNVAVTEGIAPGFLKVWPCGESVPPTSVINFAAGQTIANAVISKIGDDGVCFSSNTAVHVVADLEGWFSGPDDLNGSTPSRLLDTRTSGAPLRAGQERRLSVAGEPGIDPAASIAALNLTVDRPAAAGWLVAYPCGQQTDASTVNFLPGEVKANLALVALTNGDVCLRSLVDVEVIVDSYGWSSGTGDLRVQSPQRLLDTRAASWPFGPAPSGSTITVQVAGRGGVPSDADAAWLTAVAAGAPSAGFVTVWPCDQPMPVASTLNTSAGSFSSNLAFVKLSVEGTACLRFKANDASATPLVVDTVGWTTGGPSRTVPPNPDPTPPGPPDPAPGPGSGDPSDPVPPGPVQFSEGFESASGFYDRFDTGLSGFHPTVDPNHIESWSGDHDHSCAAPTTSREVHLGSNRDDTDELFWYCAPGGDTAKGHIMTSMNTLGYNALWFSPKPYFNDITQVCWDQNLTFMGGRKWTQVVISPRSEVERIQSQVGRLDLGFSHPGFQDPSGPTTHIIPTDATVGFTIGVGTFTMWQGATDLGGSGADLFKTEDRAARYRHCATDNQNGTVTLTQQRPDGTHTWTVAGAFPNGEVRVSFHDTNYDPPKDDDYDTTQNTWHWDNITIA